MEKKRSRKHQVWRENNKLNFQNNGSRKELTTTRKEGEREAGYKLCFCCFCFLLDISFCWIISNSSFKRGFCRRWCPLIKPRRCTRDWAKKKSTLTCRMTAAVAASAVVQLCSPLLLHRAVAASLLPTIHGIQSNFYKPNPSTLLPSIGCFPWSQCWPLPVGDWSPQ